MFKVTVVEVDPMVELGAPRAEVKRFERCVDVLDIPALIAAVNRKPRKPRTPKAKPA